ncbi:transmembrane adaptor Erv26-domain-containing protein [Paraphysoderma sedebokerense]|nr:transmembrane adaptor Erv26-domain-containing protein [Paraphysoderma sedebokerense]
MFLQLLTYIGAAAGFCFITLSLACGLYYLAELVEEYSVYTRKVIRNMTIAVIAFHVFLLFDSFPFWNILFSIICHLVYSVHLATFPVIEVKSLGFLASGVLLITNHILWFRYFSSMAYTKQYTFPQIASFFGLCVWLVPFSYFISLSANEMVLPSNNSTWGTIFTDVAVSTASLFPSFCVHSLCILQKPDSSSQPSQMKRNGLLKKFLDFMLNKNTFFSSSSSSSSTSIPTSTFESKKSDIPTPGFINANPKPYMGTATTSIPPLAAGIRPSIGTNVNSEGRGWYQNQMNAVNSRKAF